MPLSLSEGRHPCLVFRRGQITLSKTKTNRQNRAEANACNKVLKCLFVKLSIFFYFETG